MTAPGLGFGLDPLMDRCAALSAEAPSDFPAFELAGLRLFATQALASARRHGLAEAGVARRISDRMQGRLQIDRRLRDRPALRQTPLPAPVFIVGLGRSGSTLLQRLLDQDPRLRAPRLWELWRGGAQSDASAAEQIRETERRLEAWPRSALAIHPMSAEAPDECFWIMRHDACRATSHLAAGYWEWFLSLRDTELTVLCEGYRDQVSLHQAAAPDRRWLSKTFAHLHYLKALGTVFPGSTLVRIHRDPLACVASYCSLLQKATGVHAPAAFGDLVLDVFASGLDRMVDTDGELPAIDVSYDDLRRAPAATAAGVLEKLGLGPTEQAQRRLKRYLASDHRIESAPHLYALDDFGLAAADLRARFGRYLDWVEKKLDRRL